VNVRMPMDQVPERLNGPDHAWNRVGVIGHGGVHLPHHLPGRAAQFALGGGNK
jgi:hypothetical protein